MRLSVNALNLRKKPQRDGLLILCDKHDMLYNAIRDLRR